MELSDGFSSMRSSDRESPTWLVGTPLIHSCIGRDDKDNIVCGAFYMIIPIKLYSIVYTKMHTIWHPLGMIIVSARNWQSSSAVDLVSLRFSICLVTMPGPVADLIKLLPEKILLRVAFNEIKIQLIFIYYQTPQNWKSVTKYISNWQKTYQPL